MAGWGTTMLPGRVEEGGETLYITVPTGDTQIFRGATLRMTADSYAAGLFTMFMFLFIENIKFK